MENPINMEEEEKKEDPMEALMKKVRMKKKWESERLRMKQVAEARMKEWESERLRMEQEAEARMMEWKALKEESRIKEAEAREEERRMRMESERRIKEMKVREAERHLMECAAPKQQSHKGASGYWRMKRSKKKPQMKSNKIVFPVSTKEEDVGLSILNEMFIDYSIESSPVLLKEFIQEKMKTINLSKNEPYDSLIEKFISFPNSLESGTNSIIVHLSRWCSSKETLLELFHNSSEQLESIHNLENWLRILTAAADLFIAVKQIGGGIPSALKSFGMEFILTCGVPLTEKLISKKTFSDSIMAVQKEDTFIQPIKDWIMQFEEFDEVTYQIFPYGIDKSVVMDIYKYSRKLDELSQKMFVAILASNVMKDKELVKNEKFLQNAILVATSDAGKLWFIKIIAENVILKVHPLDENSTASGFADFETAMMVFKMVTAVFRDARMRVICNLATIFDTAMTLLFSTTKPKILNMKRDLQNISRCLKKDLDQVQRIADMLKDSIGVI